MNHDIPKVYNKLREAVFRKGAKSLFGNVASAVELIIDIQHGTRFRKPHESLPPSFHLLSCPFVCSSSAKGDDKGLNRYLIFASTLLLLHHSLNEMLKIIPSPSTPTNQCHTCTRKHTRERSPFHHHHHHLPLLLLLHHHPYTRTNFTATFLFPR